MCRKCNTHILDIKSEIKYIFIYLKRVCNTDVSINIKKVLLEMKDVTSYSVGEQIRHYRKIKELTQKQLANKIGVNRSYISEIESDTKFPGIEVFRKIINVLEIENKIVIPKYRLFLMNDPTEKLKQFQKENNMSSHKMAMILKTNSAYVNRWINGQTRISESVYKKLNELGIE